MMRRFRCYRLFLAFIVWLTTIKLCDCERNQQIDDRTKFLFAFPRNGEVFAPSSCHQGDCEFNINFLGWFLPPTFDYELPIHLYIRLYDDNYQKISFNKLFGGLHLVTVQYKVNATESSPAALDLHVKVMDNQNRLYLQDRMDVIISFPEDLSKQQINPAIPFKSDEQNYLAIEEYLLREYLRSEHKRHPGKKKVDYIEIGTSDFGTCLQNVEEIYNSHSLDEDHEDGQEYYHYSGISIEAVRSYLNRLPSRDSLLKLNAAVFSKNLLKDSTTTQSLYRDALSHFQISQEISWKPVYFIPDYVIERNFPEHWQIKGVAEVDRVSLFLVAALIQARASPFLLQKEYIPGFPISYLLSAVHEDHEEGVTLLKLDVEGMDKDLVFETLLFYAHRHLHLLLHGRQSLVGSLDRSWPCVIFFESKLIDELLLTDLTRLLRQLGYVLAQDVLVRWREEARDTERSEQWALREALESLLAEDLAENVLAVNCHCAADELHRSFQLLFPSIIELSDDHAAHSDRSAEYSWLTEFCPLPPQSNYEMREL